MMRRIGQLAGLNRVNTNRAWSWRQTNHLVPAKLRVDKPFIFLNFRDPPQSYLAGGKMG